MKYLIIIIIFITSCTDKKQTTEPIVIEPIIVEVIEPNLPTATYQIDNSPFYSNQNLIVVENTDNSCINTNSFIAWDSEKNRYYWIGFNVSITNIQYVLDSQYQTITSLDSKIPYNSNIVFAGYSPLDEYENSQYVDYTGDNSIYGLYVDTNTSELYRASIYPILDDGYDDVYDIVEGTDHLPVYPTRRLQYPDGRYTDKTYYTNKQGQVFDRNSYNTFGSLYLLNIKLSNNIILPNAE